MDFGLCLLVEALLMKSPCPAFRRASWLRPRSERALSLEIFPKGPSAVCTTAVAQLVSSQPVPNVGKRDRSYRSDTEGSGVVNSRAQPSGGLGEPSDHIIERPLNDVRNCSVEEKKQGT